MLHYTDPIFPLMKIKQARGIKDKGNIRLSSLFTTPPSPSRTTYEMATRKENLILEIGFHFSLYLTPNIFGTPIFTPTPQSPGRQPNPPMVEV